MNYIPDTSKVVISKMEHTTDTVKCPHCKKEYKPDTPEAEFIGWHGVCAKCVLVDGVEI